MPQSDTADYHHRVTDGEKQQRVGQTLLDEQAAEKQHYRAGINHRLRGHSDLFGVGIPGHDEGYQQDRRQLDHLRRYMPIPIMVSERRAPLTISPKNIT